MHRRSFLRKLAAVCLSVPLVDTLRRSMANEISATAVLRYAKNKSAASLSLNFTADQTGSKYEGGIQSIGTSEETLQKNDVGTIGYLAVRNNDEDNFVQLGAAAGEYSLKLKPLCGALVPWNGTAVYAKADTAACLVEYLILEL
jgi:hypothetical protein